MKIGLHNGGKIMATICIELTERDIYYLNMRALYTSDRSIGDWSEDETLTILDKLSFHKDLHTMYVWFDKKKERKLFDVSGHSSEYKIRYKLHIDLSKLEIEYLKNAEIGDWRWKNLDTILVKLKEISNSI